MKQDTDHRFTLKTLEVFSRNVEQMLVFAPEPAFASECFGSIPSDESAPSSYLSCVPELGRPSVSILDVLERRGMLGSVHRLGAAA